MQASYTLSATTDTSQCVNDGSITLSVNGATGSPTYSLLSGPASAGPYPISIPLGQSNFPSLPSGTYQAKSTDQAGISDTITVVVPGSYTFPICGDSIDPSTNCIVAYPIQGKGPFMYTISFISQSTGFSPYQSSPIFCVPCDTTYWIRMIDSCGNFYTTYAIFLGCGGVGGSIKYSCTPGTINDVVDVTVVTGNMHPPFTFHIDGMSSTTSPVTVPTICGMHRAYTKDSFGNTIFIDSFNCLTLPKLTLLCYNCGKGTATLTATGGKAPYTFTCTISGVLVMSNTTGTFANLPVRPSMGEYDFKVSDACGQISTSIVAPCMDAYLGPACPYDTTLYLRAFKEKYSPKPNYPVTFTCLNCTPTQPVVTVNSYSIPIPLFTHFTGDTICVDMKDACGDDSIYCIPMKPSIIKVFASLISCKTILATVFGTKDSLQTGAPISTGVTYYLYDPVGTLQATSSTGYFYNVPNGSWTVKASYKNCDQDPAIPISLPEPPNNCAVPNFDSLCRRTWDLALYVNGFKDRYTLYNLAGGVAYTSLPQGPGSGGAFFNDVLPGVYTIQSDSGCIYPLTLDTIPHFKLNVTNATDCFGKRDIVAKATPDTTYCNQGTLLEFCLYAHDTLIDHNTTGIFTNLPAATFTVKLYFIKTIDLFAIPAPYNSSCVLDSVVVPPFSKTNPILSTQNVHVCGKNATGNIHFKITGGVAPFTVQIAGYASITIAADTGVYTGVPPGQYTMQVSDYCGVSNSMSMSVVDTCVSCPGNAKFVILDTLLCLGDSVRCISQSVKAKKLFWYLDGVLMGMGQKITFLATPAGRHAVQMTYIDDFCTDSVAHTLTIDTSIAFNLGPDTAICNAFSMTLNSGSPLTVWSTGSHQAAIRVTHGGTYWATARNGCGQATDTVHIVQNFSPQVYLADFAPLCRDSSVRIQVYSVPPSSFQWTRITGDSFITISAPGVYHVTASYKGCVTVDSVIVSYYYEPTGIIKLDQPACVGKEVNLSVTYGTNPIWNDSIAAQTLHIDNDGVYTVYVKGQCKGVRDTVSIHFRDCDCTVNVPTGFSPNHDGNNDVYRAIPYCHFQYYNMKIYNRWGEQVFQTESPDVGWDGTFNGQPQGMGVYICYISYRAADSPELRSWSQNLTLIR